MVLPLRFSRTSTNRIYDNGEYPIVDNRGKAGGTSLFPASKKKNRRMQVVFALLLSWCMTVLLFSIGYGVPSLPGYEYTVEQAVFPVRQLLIMGWEQATSELKPQNEETRHVRKLATEVKETHDNPIIFRSDHQDKAENEAITTDKPKEISTVSDHEKTETYDRHKSINLSNKDILLPDHAAGNGNKQMDVSQLDVSGKGEADEDNPSRETRHNNIIIESSAAKGIIVVNNADSRRSKPPRDDQNGNDSSSLEEKQNVEQLGEKTNGDQKITDQILIRGEINGEGLLTQKFSDRFQVIQEITCDRSHWRTDVCIAKGNVRVKAKSVQLVTWGRNETQQPVTETVKPYTRKWEMPLMGNIDEVKIETVDASSNPTSMAACEFMHAVPSIIFSTGGYTGNVYHDFNDGLIPLYITSRHLKGEVVFLILDFHEWWLMRYGGIIRQLSNYPVIDLRNDETVHCFPEVTVGLKIHDELTVNDDQMPKGKGSIKDFHRIIQKAYSLSVIANKTTYDSSLYLKQVSVQKKPKLVLIARRGSRSISNQAEVVDLIKQLGFEVDVTEPHGGTRLEDIFTLLNSCDVMMGVHGAAMTHLLFMRPGTIFIQIIPLGTDGPALSFYGQPAIKLGLHYMEYKVKPRESSLSKTYRKSSEVLTNPEAVASRGWLELKKYYLDGQSVTLHLPRLKLTLQKALKTIKKRVKE